MKMERLKAFRALLSREQPLLPILMYHHIAERPAGAAMADLYVSPKEFESQLSEFKRLGFRSVDLANLNGQDLPRRPIALTFDDGYVDFFTNALPLLRSYGFHATVFAVPGHIAGVNAWDRGNGPEERLMDQEELRTCQRQGCEIGAHTCSHPDLRKCDLNAARREIADSKTILEELLDRNVEAFCYPYGGFTEPIVQIVRESGYSCACTTEPGLNTSAADRYTLRRVNCKPNSGAVRWLVRAIALRT
jgi:peptidoglycan/xylan/chitin deacetylase (PgdA/CDA1 family)